MFENICVGETKKNYFAKFAVKFVVFFRSIRSIFITFSILIGPDSEPVIYTEYHEMPQKACERKFCHVIAFSQFLKCLKIEEFHGSFSVLKLITC